MRSFTSLAYRIHEHRYHMANVPNVAFRLCDTVLCIWRVQCSEHVFVGRAHGFNRTEIAKHQWGYVCLG